MTEHKPTKEQPGHGRLTQLRTSCPVSHRILCGFVSNHRWQQRFSAKDSKFCCAAEQITQLHPAKYPVLQEGPPKQQSMLLLSDLQLINQNSAHFTATQNLHYLPPEFPGCRKSLPLVCILLLYSTATRSTSRQLGWAVVQKGSEEYCLQCSKQPPGCTHCSETEQRERSIKNKPSNLQTPPKQRNKANTTTNPPQKHKAKET